MGKGGKGMACRREWFREERMTHERLEICFGDGRLGLLLVKPLILCRAQKKNKQTWLALTTPSTSRLLEQSNLRKTNRFFR
jgi:hypothetical protein